MSEQIEDPKGTKVEEEVVSATSEDKVQHIANEAAGKAAKTEQHYDADHAIFSK
jgi:hypothetical protein